MVILSNPWGKHGVNRKIPKLNGFSGPQLHNEGVSRRNE